VTRRAGSLTAVLATAACGVCLAVRPPAEASAHDSLGPPGAAHTWLPDEDWVMRHWVPFDERALTSRLALRAGDLEAYLYDDHHALADLARARGLDVALLRDELVAPWRPLVDDQRYALLRERAANERRVERLRKRLRHGCWPRPRAWSWPAHGLTAP
jgi:hypothetical protein